jgi:hypothetical protein
MIQNIFEMCCEIFGAALSVTGRMMASEDPYTAVIGTPSVERQSSSHAIMQFASSVLSCEHECRTCNK